MNLFREFVIPGAAFVGVVVAFYLLLEAFRDGNE